MPDKFIGIDIGGTKCAVILGNTDANILNRKMFETVSTDGPESAIKKIKYTINELLEDQGWNISDVKSIGISCGGPLDSQNGIILSPPNLLGWDEVPIVSIFKEEYRIPVFLQNDANACAIAEWQFGAGKGSQNMIFLTFGTGFGAGLILNGKLYSGTNDMAGEIGHVRIAEDGPVGYGKSGSMEGYCSGGGIAQLAQMIVKEKINEGFTVSFCASEKEAEQLTAKDVGLAAEAGDATAIEILNLSGRYLGKGLSILIDILNPELIVIGSIFARATKFLWPPAETEIKKEALPLSYSCCNVVPAQLDEQIGDYGSLCVAMYGANVLREE